MTPIQELTCANCGASLPVRAAKETVVSCEFCGTSFRVPGSLTPEPEMGDLILGADFKNPNVPGWVLSEEKHVTFEKGPPAELWAKYPPSDLIHSVIRTPGHFDDFDISVTVRFIEGSYKHISAGLELRHSDDGDYVVRISAQGTFQIGWHKEKEWGGTLLDWTDHPALKREMEQANRLRVVMQGDRLRVYLNGVLATSLRDDHFQSGHIRTVIAPSEKKPGCVAAFANLQLREVS